MKNTYRILAKGEYMDNNTRHTGINNNDLIVGPSGAGKTRSYVKPNIMQGNESFFITDTKGDLKRQLEPLLLEKGYEIKCIDFKDFTCSNGYNPFDYVRYDKETKKYSEQDINTIAEAIVPQIEGREPIWSLLAKQYLLCLIAYMFETCPTEEHHLWTVYKLYSCLSNNQQEFSCMISELGLHEPNSLAVKKFRFFEGNQKAERMHRSIMGILAEKLNGLILEEQIRMFQEKDRVNFCQVSRKKMIVFLNVSDTDRSMDRLVSLFYAQALNTLCNEADRNDNSRLNIPVRFIFDDFATNCLIPNFPEIISVIRSREIYVSIILQSISQLNGLYGSENAKTIINNCNTCLYLGGQDIKTAECMANKAGVDIQTVLNLPLNHVYLFISGREPVQVERFQITEHPDYELLPEAVGRKDEVKRKKVRNTYRILSQGEYLNNNTWHTGINNNDLIIGPSGAGKTRSYVKPNIMQGNESLMITDTKGDLRKQLTPILLDRGYEIKCIDLKDMISSQGYNPFDNIRYDKETDTYLEQDIITVACVLIPTSLQTDDPFWVNAARLYMQCLISFVLEILPVEEHNLDSVSELFYQIKEPEEFKNLIAVAEEKNLESCAAKTYGLIAGNEDAEKMHASILGIMVERISAMTLEEAVRMYKLDDRIEFEQIGKKKTAVFLIVSDTDRSNDTLVSIFYTQALNKLCNAADGNPDSRLQVPVRFIFDDFATNCVIPNFPEIISVIRSREIYVSIILQSISQLNGLYGIEGAETIINNCDNCLYLGGQDDETARYIGLKANRTINEILNMPLGSAYLFTRGRKPKLVQKFNITEHPGYDMLLGEG